MSTTTQATLDAQVCARLQAARRLTARQFDQARGDSVRWGTSIGDTLAAAGVVSARDWAEAVAGVTGLPLADLLAEPPDPALLRVEDRRDYLALGAIPWRRESDGGLLVAVIRPDGTEALLPWLAQRFPGVTHALAVTAKFDILWSVQRAFDDLPQPAAAPAEPSARQVLGPLQAWCLALLPGLGLTALLVPGWAPWLPYALLLPLAAAYLLPLLAILPLAWAGAQRRAQLALPGNAREAAALREVELPVFTLLVPIHRESAILPVLAEGIRRLDYPRAKLDVKLVMEADDTGTIEAAKALRAEAIFEIVRVPPPRAGGQPRTRGRALNYALRFARGEFLAVLDAQSIPAPDQLRQVMLAFRHRPAHLACVQSRQNCWNPDEAALTRLAALEFGQWSDLLLPGLALFGMPVPLRGATCHFRTEAVAALGGWDAHHAAGDADLALRLAREGHGIAAVRSATLEEACRAPGPWLRQRSRGLRGLMQTTLVQARRPRALWRGLGPAGVLGFSLLVAGPALAALALPPLLGLVLLQLAGVLALPGWLGWVAPVSLAAGFWIQAYAMLLGTLRRQDFRLAPWVLLAPAYALLEGVAAWMAAVQLAWRPSRVPATPHGTSAGLDALLLALRSRAPIR